jgi:ATP-dependent Lon protease
MSGELTLTGQVLAIGGIKEKVIAAQKGAGCRTLIFPTDNRADFNQLPHYLTENIDIHFTENLRQVTELAFQK